VGRIIYSVVDHLGFWTIRDRLDSIYMYECIPVKVMLLNLLMLAFLLLLSADKALLMSMSILDLIAQLRHAFGSV
jgi:hypothetical protein